jgi:hypothetical protein
MPPPNTGTKPSIARPAIDQYQILTFIVDFALKNPYTKNQQN